MRITYKNSGVGKGAMIEMSPREVKDLIANAKGDPRQVDAKIFTSELLIKLEQAVFNGDSEAEEGGGA